MTDLDHLTRAYSGLIAEERRDFGALTKAYRHIWRRLENPDRVLRLAQPLPQEEALGIMRVSREAVQGLETRILRQEEMHSRLKEILAGTSDLRLEAERLEDDLRRAQAAHQQAESDFSRRLKQYKMLQKDPDVKFQQLDLLEDEVSILNRQIWRLQKDRDDLRRVLVEKERVVNTLAASSGSEGAAVHLSVAAIQLTQHGYQSRVHQLEASLAEKDILQADLQTQLTAATRQLAESQRQVGRLHQNMRDQVERLATTQHELGTTQEAFRAHRVASARLNDECKLKIEAQNIEMQIKSDECLRMYDALADRDASLLALKAELSRLQSLTAVSQHRAADDRHELSVAASTIERVGCLNTYHADAAT
ncbi:MAG: uncharacterized protein KVP18_000492 [Porospora cf. gigantea A]|uniref:uncharacterized protein n=1 Tax=Porospora cf. gigantea A TaxID=2853593 RepID=UPI00355A268B|nr:MAG: hypothetical protein KVP18_000492 [Porospora cf. gigantea A]